MKDEQSEYYKLQIEGWHLFYESFIESSIAIENSRGILFDMQHEVLIAGKKNPSNPKLLETEKRLAFLHLNFDMLEKLNNRCINLQRQLKSKVSENLELMDQNELLKKEIEVIKKAFNETDK